LELGVTHADDQEHKLLVPVEVEIYINADGSVTFADLEEKTVLIARSLDPEQPLTCHHSGPGIGGAAVEHD
jgi:hypothetical protein